MILSAMLVMSATMVLPMENDLDVRLFGAKGDGVSDDSAAFIAAGRELTQKASMQAKRWGNRNCADCSGSVEGPRPRIWVPKGKYLLKNTAMFEKNLMIVGEDGAEIVTDDPQMDIFYVYQAYRVRIENLTFDGGHHQLFMETCNAESANLQLTGCKFRNSSAVAFYSPSLAFKDENGKSHPCSKWYFDRQKQQFLRNENYVSDKLIGHYHSSMIAIENCDFYHCESAFKMDPDGAMIRNSTITMAPDSTNAAFYAHNILHGYGLKIVTAKNAPAIRGEKYAITWIEDSDIFSPDGSGAIVFEGEYYSHTIAPQLVLSDIRTDAAMRKDNAICRFNNTFPPIAALIRVNAQGPNQVRAFAFGPKVDAEAFNNSYRIHMWEPERYFSYGIRDCSANILPIEEGSYAKKFERPIPEWAAPAGGKLCHLNPYKLSGAKRKTYPGTWQVETMTTEIKEDTIIDARGVAALVGLSSERPWFVVKKGAKALFRNLQTRGGRSFVVVEDGAQAYVDACFSYDAEGPAFACQKGGRLVVDNGVHYAAVLYEGDGDAFIRSIWYRFTELGLPTEPIPAGAGLINRGRLTTWDVLGVPTVFGRYGHSSAADDLGFRLDVRWVDNSGTYRSRFFRFGGEMGGVTPVWQHGDAHTLIEGHFDWYYRITIPDTPILCDTERPDAKLFAVSISPYRQYLKYIGLQRRDASGKDVPIESSGMAFTCPTAEVK